MSLGLSIVRPASCHPGPWSSILFSMQYRIVFVPGKNPKPSAAIHKQYLWRCLQTNLQRVAPQLGNEIEQCRFELAAWNFDYYLQHASLTTDIPWIERLLKNPEATQEDIEEARSWKKWSISCMYALGDRFHRLIRYIPDPRVKEMISDTLRYFDNTDGVADMIREKVKDQIRQATEANQRLCLIGHSMGSVIAYEALWQLTHRDKEQHIVDLFLTLGSPLGMHYVQKQLLGFHRLRRSFPVGITRWVNVSAVGDLVSVDSTVNDDFHRMIKAGLVQSITDVYEQVYTAFRNANGLNVHRSYGYMVHPQVGEALARWWQGGAS